VFNIACNERTSLNRLYRRLQELLDSDIAPVYGPSRVGDVRDSLADISKGGRLLGYKGELKFDEGLRRSIEWYRENL
jgi:nucleoside-diphosphate-sugar epimerase